MNSKPLPVASMALSLCLTLVAPATAAAQAYVDQANGNGRSAYVEQMPAGAKPVLQKRLSSGKRTTSQRTSGAGRLARQVAQTAEAGRAQAEMLPSVGAGSSAIVRLDESAVEWPTVGRGTVNR